MKITLMGLKETIRNLNSIAKQLGSMETPMRQATMVVTRAAKQNAPVDTGRLRASIMPSVQSGGSTTVGVVGSNVKYAPFMELGTKPHFPPPSALETWARRHGFTSAYIVCRAIARRGLKARRYLQKAFEANVYRINQIFNEYVRRIIQ